MLAMVGAVTLAVAQASAAQDGWRSCVARTTTNADWATCGHTYIRQADDRLNAEWKRLLALSSGRTRADLVAEERAWVAYRQTACRFYADGDWGREGQVLHYAGCVAGVIERRTAELARYRAFVGAR